MSPSHSILAGEFCLSKTLKSILRYLPNYPKILAKVSKNKKSEHHPSMILAQNKCVSNQKYLLVSWVLPETCRTVHLCGEVLNSVNLILWDWTIEIMLADISLQVVCCLCIILLYVLVKLTCTLQIKPAHLLTAELYCTLLKDGIDSCITTQGIILTLYSKKSVSPKKVRRYTLVL